jgi:hypothetical protein
MLSCGGLRSPGISWLISSIKSSQLFLSSFQKEIFHFLRFFKKSPENLFLFPISSLHQ